MNTLTNEEILDRIENSRNGLAFEMSEEKEIEFLKEHIRLRKQLQQMMETGTCMANCFKIHKNTYL